ncbi:hypothetical protein BVY04_04555 [bacterium M21]|nr:hypothetical protein BVY04_04555 [bacterium M21]
MAKDTNYWYQRTIEQLLLTGKSKRTAETYAREVRILGKCVDKPLDKLNEEELRQFILYRLNDCKLAGSSMRILYCGLKALYQDVMGNKWPLLKVLKSSKESRLPMAIDRSEVEAILAGALTP